MTHAFQTLAPPAFPESWTTRARLRCCEAMLSSEDELELLTEVCSALVEEGGLSLCWVGLALHDAHCTVSPVAWAGVAGNFLAEADVVWSDTQRGLGPEGEAIRTGRPVLGRDFARSASLQPWRRAAQERGFRGCSALPLRHGRESLGSLSLYTAEPVQWQHQEEAELLLLADALALVLLRLRHRAALDRERTVLARSEERLRRAFQALREPAALCDWEGARIVEANAAFRAITGCRPGQSLTGLAAGRAETALLEAAAEGPGLRVELHPSGAAPRSALAWSTPVDVDGALHALVMLREVSDQDRQQLLLRRLAAAVEHTPASVVITDLEGKVEYVNPAFEAVTGYTRLDTLGQRACFFENGEQDAAVFRELWATIRSGRSWQGRLVNRTRQGRLLTEDVAIAPVRDEGGAICNYVAVKRDVTPELELQQQLASAHRLESIGRLAGGIAHDFNNLLAVILLGADALLTQPGGDPASLVEIVHELVEAANRGRELTGQLLAFARKQPTRPRAVDLNALVHSGERLLRRLLHEDIAVECRLQPDLWPVFCDQGQLEQVLLNLAANAGDAMQRGGELTITTARLDADHPARALFVDLPAGEFALLSVSDTGCGMSAEVKARLFEPFFTTKEPGKGTGLGLATVHGIVAQAGGAIRCESAPGAGTTFQVCLPRAAAGAAPCEAPKAPEPRPAAAVKILLAEDDPQVRSTTVRALEECGHHVTVAADGEAALQAALAAGGPFDLVISDVVMPGLDGGALAAALHQRWPDLPVLFVSGYPDQALSSHGVTPDRCELLWKPFSGQELAARVQQLLEARATARRATAGPP